MNVNVLRWPALACIALTVACGAKGHSAKAPVASHPVAPVITPTEAAMGNAARAEVDGRAGEALAAYESMIAADPPLPEPDRLHAMLAAARLRLSADPDLHDLAKARALLLAAAAINPRLSAMLPASDLLALLDRETQAQEQLDQRTSSLQTENRTLRTTIKQLQAELAKAQDELAKKDEALHRATEKLLEKSPRPR